MIRSGHLGRGPKGDERNEGFKFVEGTFCPGRSGVEEGWRGMIFVCVSCCT